MAKNSKATSGFTNTVIATVHHCITSWSSCDHVF